MKKKLPEMSQENVNKACTILVIAMLNTNAGEMKITQEKFHNPEGEVLGDFKITVKKIK
jgi:hypothetical protein